MENVQGSVKPEMRARLDDLRAAFFLLKGVDVGRRIAVRWSAHQIELILLKPGFQCVVCCPLVTTQGANPQHQWCLETDISLFDQLLCNEKIWKTFLPNREAIVSIGFRDLSTDLRQEQLPDRMTVDVKCLSWSAKWHFEAIGLDESLTRCEGTSVNPRAIASTMSAALPFADKRADGRYQLIEYSNGSAQAGSPRGLRVVQSARVSSVTVRAGRSYAKALSSAFGKMDPQNTKIWSVENRQHIADSKIHCAILESQSDVPSANLTAEPMLSGSMRFIDLMKLVSKAIGQMSDKEGALRFGLEIGAVSSLKFAVPVRGGVANVTSPIKVSETSEQKYSRFEANLPKAIISKIGEGIRVGNQTAILAFHEKFLRIDVEDDEIVVRSLLAYDGVLASVERRLG